MPAAPRPVKAAEKIAYKLLGKPANLSEKPDAKQRRIMMLLIQEQLTRTR